MSTQRIVELILRWVEDQKDVPKHIADRIVYLNDVSAQLGKRLGLTKEEMLDTFLRVGANSAKLIKSYTKEVEGQAGAIADVTAESANWAILMEALGIRFKDEGISYKKLNETFNQLAKDWGTNSRDIVNRVVDSSTVVVAKNLAISDALAGVSEKQDAAAEATKKATAEAEKVKTAIGSWQNFAKQQYMVSDAALENEKQSRLLAQTIIKNKGIIDDNTAAMAESIAPTANLREWKSKLATQILKTMRLGEKEEKSRKKATKSLTRVGMRWSWLGYRLQSIGRVMQRWITAPIQKMIGILTDWESSIQSAAMGFALAEYFGVDLGMTTEELSKLFGDFAIQGLNVQQSLGQLQLAFMQLAVDVGPTFANTIRSIADTLGIIWAESGPQIIAALERLAGVITDKLLPLLEDIGAEMIIAFIEGFTGATAALISFMSFLEPFMPWITKLLGIITGLSPVFIAFGMALFLLVPTLQLLITLWPLFVAGFSIILAPMNTVYLAIMAIVLVIDLLIKNWEKVTQTVQNFGKWVGKLFGHSVGAIIAKDLGKAAEMFDQLGVSAAMPGIGGARGGGATFQNVYPEISISIGNVTGVEDLSAISDAAERGLSEALRRRAYPRWGRR